MSDMPKIVKATAYIEYDNGLIYDLDFEPSAAIRFAFSPGKSAMHATCNIAGLLTGKATRTPPRELPEDWQ